MRKRKFTLAGAAEDNKALLSLIKFIVVISNCIHKDVQPEALAKMAKAYGVEAIPLLTSWKADVASFKKIINLTPKMSAFVNLTDSQWDMIDEYFTDLMPLIKEIAHTELHLPKDNLAMLVHGMRSIYNGSETGYKYLIARVGSLGDLALAKALAPKAVGKKSVAGKRYAEVKDQVAALVLKWANVKGHTMPGDAKAKFREKDPAGYKEYLALGRELAAYYRQVLQSLIRSSGKPTMNVDTVRAELDQMGVVHSLPKGFVGSIDDQSALYTIKGDKLKQRPTGEVRMNPKWANNPRAYYCEYRVAGTPTWNKAQTEEHVNKAKSERYDAVDKMVVGLEKYRRKWVADFKSKKQPQSTYALLVELAYLISPRIGTKGNATKKNGKEIDTYGLTTLRVKHVKSMGSRIVMKYPGKSGEIQTHEVIADSPVSKLAVAAIKVLLEGKDKEQHVFTLDSLPVKGDDVNTYLRKLGVPITYHGFRKVRGTFLMKKWLGEFKVKGASPKDVNNHVLEGLKEVGKALGHFNRGEVTGATALKSYINPSILANFYRAQNVRPSPTIESAIKEALAEEQ